MDFATASKTWDTEEEGQSVTGCFWMEGDSLAPPCQTDLEIVECILDLACPTSDSVVYDLGCGDGRICALASKIYGCKSCGAEIEPHLVEKFRSNLLNEGDIVSNLVKVYEGDLRDIDLNDATIIIIYLLPESIIEITPMLVKALERGAVLVCNTWGPKILNHIEKRTVGENNNINLFKYTIESLPSK